MMKKALVVNGHPSEESLVSEATRRVQKACEKAGYEIEYVRAMDLPRNPHIMAEGYDESCTEICKKVSEAEVIVVSSPVWWFGPTSGVKDFLDGALQAGKQFKYVKKFSFLPASPVGLMNPKTKLITITTTGGPALLYNLGILPNYAKRIIQKSFAFCGLKKCRMKHFHFGNAGKSTPKAKFDAWLDKLENIKI